jgi:hypothetical protein
MSLSQPPARCAGRRRVHCGPALRQVLLWPLRLMPVARHGNARDPRPAPWKLLRRIGDASPWREVGDEFNGKMRGKALASVWRLI